MASSILEALEIITNSIPSLDAEIIPIENAVGRVVTEDYIATFDLPSNTFWETWVATTVIVAYKPKDNEQHLLTQDYSVFVKEIEHTGYEVKTKDRIVTFQPTFLID